DVQAFPMAIAKGATVTGTITVTVPPAPACNSGNEIIYRIRTITEQEELQCLCKPAEFQSSTALPVRLAEFKAIETREGLSEPTWTTTSETNFAYFDIEHSLDGISWMPIGQVEAVKHSPAGA